MTRLGSDSPGRWCLAHTILGLGESGVIVDDDAKEFPGKVRTRGGHRPTLA